MKNVDIEAAYKQVLPTGHAAALRFIYNLGFYRGAAVAPDSNSVEQSRQQTAPSQVDKDILAKLHKKPDD